MSLEEIAKIIRLSRKAKQLTQEEAAEAIKISLSSYKSIENGYRAAGINAYTKIANYFDISFDISIPIRKKTYK